MLVRIDGEDLPGVRCRRIPEKRDGSGEQHANVHVGVQGRREVVDLVPGSASSARWVLEVTTRDGADGELDVGGPFVHGRRGDRFVYLSWGEVTPTGEFVMFRRAKLHFGDVDPDLLREAAGCGATLVARVRLSDDHGQPRGARVRPPDVLWRLESDPG